MNFNLTTAASHHPAHGSHDFVGGIWIIEKYQDFHNITPVAVLADHVRDYCGVDHDLLLMEKKLIKEETDINAL